MIQGGESSRSQAETTLVPNLSRNQWLPEKREENHLRSMNEDIDHEVVCTMDRRVKTNLSPVAAIAKKSPTLSVQMQPPSLGLSGSRIRSGGRIPTVKISFPPRISVRHQQRLSRAYTAALDKRLPCTSYFQVQDPFPLSSERGDKVCSQWGMSRFVKSGVDFSELRIFAPRKRLGHGSKVRNVSLFPDTNSAHHATFRSPLQAIEKTAKALDGLFHHGNIGISGPDDEIQGFVTNRGIAGNGPVDQRFCLGVDG